MKNIQGFGFSNIEYMLRFLALNRHETPYIVFKQENNFWLKWTPKFDTKFDVMAKLMDRNFDGRDQIFVKKFIFKHISHRCTTTKNFVAISHRIQKIISKN